MRRLMIPILTLALAMAAAPSAHATQSADSEREAGIMVGLEANDAAAGEVEGAFIAAPRSSDDALDSRWLAWVGCWEPTDLDQDPQGSELLVCFDRTAEGVEVVTYSDGEPVGVEHIVADGRPVAAADGGCEGTREARWSDDGRRAFVLSDLECSEGVHRVTKGVFAMADGGSEWLEIHGVRSADRDQAMAVRAFRPASNATLARHDITAPGAGQDLAIRTSRMAAAGPLDRDALVEASSVVGAEVTAALVAEMAEPYSLDAGVLRSYASAGVPDEVIDMMIAVSYPDRFVVQAGEARPAPARTPDTRAAYPMGPTRYGPMMRCRSWDRFCWDPVYRDMLWYYGAPGYAFGGGYGWGFRGPRYIVVPGTVRGSRGSVSPDQGFRAPRSEVRPARPAETRPSQGVPVQTRPAQVRPGQPSQTRPTTPPRQTRPATRRGGDPVPTTRPTPPPRTPPAASSGGGRVNPTSGHTSGSRGGGGSDNRPTRSAGSSSGSGGG